MHRNCVAAEATRSEVCGRGSIREEREEAVTRVQVSSHLVHSAVSTRGLIEWEELAEQKSRVTYYCASHFGWISSQTF